MPASRSPRPLSIYACRPNSLALLLSGDRLLQYSGALALNASLSLCAPAHLLLTLSLAGCYLMKKYLRAIAHVYVHVLKWILNSLLRKAHICTHECTQSCLHMRTHKHRHRRERTGKRKGKPAHTARPCLQRRTSYIDWQWWRQQPGRSKSVARLRVARPGNEG